MEDMNRVKKDIWGNKLTETNINLARICSDRLMDASNASVASKMTMSAEQRLPSAQNIPDVNDISRPNTNLKTHEVRQLVDKFLNREEVVQYLHDAMFTPASLPIEIKAFEKVMTKKQEAKQALHMSDVNAEYLDDFASHNMVP